MAALDFHEPFFARVSPALKHRCNCSNSAWHAPFSTPSIYLWGEQGGERRRFEEEVRGGGSRRRLEDGWRRLGRGGQGRASGESDDPPSPPPPGQYAPRPHHPKMAALKRATGAAGDGKRQLVSSVLFDAETVATRLLGALRKALGHSAHILLAQLYRSWRLWLHLPPRPRRAARWERARCES
jgi:hypothetical protein